jgi:hypothetical protein
MAKSTTIEAPPSPDVSSGIEAVEPPPSSAAATASLQYADAQHRFEQAIQEGQVLLGKVMIDAYRECTARQLEAHRELEDLAVEAYKNHLSALTEVSASSTFSGPGADAYQEYCRLGTELSTQYALYKPLENAYQQLTVALTEAQNHSEPAASTATAYSAYFERLKEASTLAEKTRSQAEEAYSTLLSAYSEDCTRHQSRLQTAYQAYINGLREAYTRSDFERRMATATKEYTTAAQNALKQSMSIYAAAAADLIDAHKSAGDNLQPP